MENKLKEIRKEKAMSVSKLARLSNTSRSRIYAIENGTAENVTIGTLTRIANVLGVAVNDIFVL